MTAPSGVRRAAASRLREAAVEGLHQLATGASQLVINAFTPEFRSGLEPHADRPLERRSAGWLEPHLGARVERLRAAQSGAVALGERHVDGHVALLLGLRGARGEHLRGPALEAVA